MMPENTISRGRKVKAAIVIAVLVAALGYLASILVFQHEANVKRSPPGTIIEFTGLPEGAAVDATIHMNGRTRALPYADGKLVLTPEEKADFALPFTIAATLRTPDEKYHDFTWKIDARGVEYSVTADGFSPKDKIMFSLDGSPSVDIPFDWSGRIEIPAMLIIAKNTKACIEIWASGKLLGACHMVTGKLPA